MSPSNFIKLHSLIINSNDIIFIEHNHDNYKIHMRIDILGGNTIITPKGIQISKNIIEVFKSKNPLEYDIIEEWIKHL